MKYFIRKTLWKIKRFLNDITLKSLIGINVMNKYSDMKQYNIDINSAYHSMIINLGREELEKIIQKVYKKRLDRLKFNELYTIVNGGYYE